MPESPDEIRFRSAYQAHTRALLGYALRRTATPADAADVVAETMLTAWRRLDVMPDEPETILWLYGVARNVIANGDRTQRRQRRLAEKLRSQLDNTLEAPTVADPALTAQVTAAMKSLTPVEHEVLNFDRGRATQSRRDRCGTRHEAEHRAHSPASSAQQAALSAHNRCFGDIHDENETHRRRRT